MKQLWLGSTLVVCLAACASNDASAAKPAHAAWSYEGATGPGHWADISPDYALAKTGKRQSPVDIVPSQATSQDLPPIQIAYRPTALELLNNGHTIEDESHHGGSITVDGHAYELVQFHFHSPSEHTIAGQHAPLEIHLVHKDGAGKLAVLGVLVHEGQANQELAVLWPHMPTAPGGKEEAEGVQVDAAKLLPSSLATYRYSGSLTTPPCSEDVAWFVLQQPIEASAEQIAAFRKVIHDNNRPTQPLNGRTIAASK